MAESRYEPASFSDFIPAVGGSMRVSPDVQMQRDQVRLAMLQQERIDNPDDPFLPRVIDDTARKIEGGDPFAVPGRVPNRGSRIAAERQAKKVSYEPMTFGDQPAPAGVTYEPMFPEDKAAVAPKNKIGVSDVAGRGTIHGLMGLAEAVNIGVQFIGNRVGSSGMAEQGASGAEYWASSSKPYEAPVELQGAIIENPSLLANAAWWLYNLEEIFPSFAAAIIPGVGAAKMIGVAGQALKLTPTLIQRLAILGGSIVGGGVGGSLEGAQTYQEVLKRGAPEPEAAVAGSMMTLASAALNAFSVGRVIAPGKMGAVMRFLTTGATEGVTEWLEEPAEGAILGRTSVAKPEDDPVERAKQGLNVMPIAAVMGGGAGLVAGGQGRAETPPPGPGDGGAYPNIDGEGRKYRDVSSGGITYDDEVVSPFHPDRVYAPDTEIEPNFRLAIPRGTSTIDQARVDAQTLREGGELGLMPGSPRLKNAELVRIYGENAAVRHVIESPEMFGAIGEAMLKAAPTVERVRGAIAQNERQRDITDDILGAVDEITRIRKEGGSVAETLAEGVSHDLSYEGQQLAQFLDQNADNPQALADFLENYLHEVERATGVPSRMRNDVFEQLEKNKAEKEAIHLIENKSIPPELHLKGIGNAKLAHKEASQLVNRLDSLIKCMRAS